MKKSHWLGRLCVAILTVGLIWAVYFFLSMGAWVSINHCHANFSCFTDTLILFLQRNWLLALACALASGFWFWLIIEFNKYLIPEIEVTPSFEPLAAGVDSSFIEISHQPQWYPPSFLARKSPWARDWMVFVDDQPVASLPQLGTVQVPLSTGSHDIFVGFENRKSLWKRAQRSTRITVNFQEGQSAAYDLRFNHKLILVHQLLALLFIILLLTQTLWVAPVLNAIPDFLWRIHPALPEVVAFGVNYNIFAALASVALSGCFFYIYTKQGLMLTLEPRQR